MKKVIVTSKNPVKINATRKAFESMFPHQQFEVQGASVPSNVSNQPMTDEETLRGAVNRVNNAKEALPDADYWVGIEGGIQERGEVMDTFGWMVIANKDRQVETRSSSFPLPPKVAEGVRSGKELGLVIDEFFKKHNSKQGSGAIGSLTEDKMTRTDLYVQPLVFALIPFLKKELFVDEL